MKNVLSMSYTLPKSSRNQLDIDQTMLTERIIKSRIVLIDLIFHIHYT